MTTRIFTSTKRRLAFLAAVLLCLFAPPAQAAEFFLRAEAYTAQMPDGRQVTLWGFAQDSAFGALDGVPSVPGPVLTVPPGDSTLTVNLDNNLPEPVSLVIAGQPAVFQPVRDVDGRAVSLTTETAPGNAAPVTYTWTGLRPGTYLYQSGSHIQVQVQMGLYGAMIHDAAGGQAYGPDSAFDAQLLLVYGEIDPELHDAVAAGDYGPGKGTVSTVKYKPRYFLVNGRPFGPGTSALTAGAAGETTLLRLVNAGLMTHVPMLQGLEMLPIAEDGNPVLYPLPSYTVQLAAGKTIDVLIAPLVSGYLPLIDRRLYLASGLKRGSGLLSHLRVPAASSTLTVARRGRGKVTMKSLPGGIDCGADCVESIETGTRVLVHAAPSRGWLFAGWSGACRGTGDCAVTLNANKKVTATFIRK